MKCLKRIKLVAAFQTENRVFNLFLDYKGSLRQENKRERDSHINSIEAFWTATKSFTHLFRNTRWKPDMS